MILAAVCVAFFLGSLVQTIAGFGSALIIMPIITQFLGVQTAATVMAIVGATVTVAVLYQNRRGLRWAEAGQLLTGAVVGVPLGTYALKRLPSGIVVGLLGALLLAYGVYSIWANRKTVTASAEPGDAPARGNRVVSALVGLCAGLLGGAYATDGPPLVVYGAVKRWPKETFRSVLQACFFVDGILIVLCHGAGGLVTQEVFVYCLYGVPGMAIGLVTGMLLDRHVDHARFVRMLPWFIAVLGLALLVRAVLGA